MNSILKITVCIHEFLEHDDTKYLNEIFQYCKKCQFTYTSHKAIQTDDVFIESLQPSYDYLLPIKRKKWDFDTNKYNHNNKLRLDDNGLFIKDEDITHDEIIPFYTSTGFNDEDFHIVSDSDERWTITDDKIVRNKTLTELTLAEKEIAMVKECNIEG